jgi:hypothetical protein
MSLARMEPDTVEAESREEGTPTTEVQSRSDVPISVEGHAGASIPTRQSIEVEPELVHEEGKTGSRSESEDQPAKVEMPSPLDKGPLDKGKGRAVQLDDGGTGKLEEGQQMMHEQLAALNLDNGHPPPPMTVLPRHKQEEQEEQWPLKEIAWPPLPAPPDRADAHGDILSKGLTIKVITQNLNGPCSLIALCASTRSPSALSPLPLTRVGQATCSY